MVVALLRAEGAGTHQPRATPWELGHHKRLRPEGATQHL